MSNLIERIAKSVEFAEKEGENMDDVSWGMQEGILISYNEAKKILFAYEALQKVLKWEMPVTGQFWDKEEKQPMSYAAAYGSNGERDYIKSIAKAAISKCVEP
jgi:hypothetical protein